MSNELNERAAKAMGWKPNCMQDSQDRPDYATDPATIPEMLAHLQKDAESLRVEIALLPNEVEISAYIEYEIRTFLQGDTLNLALANLVVAVSEAKKS